MATSKYGRPGLVRSCNREPVSLASSDHRRIDTFEQHRELACIDLDVVATIRSRDPTEGADLEPLHQDAVAITIPEQHADLVGAAVHEDEDVARADLASVLTFDDRGES